MEANLIIILGGAVLSMIVGSIWYGPLFGKKWMEICGVSTLDGEAQKKMQKEAIPLYVIQFILSVLQIYILTNLIEWGGWTTQSIWVAVFIWLGFVMPTIAGSAMWNNNPNRLKIATFLIQSGYQLIMFIIYGWILSMWG